VQHSERVKHSRHDVAIATAAAAANASSISSTSRRRVASIVVTSVVELLFELQDARQHQVSLGLLRIVYSTLAPTPRACSEPSG